MPNSKGLDRLHQIAVKNGIDPLSGQALNPQPDLPKPSGLLVAVCRVIQERVVKLDITGKRRDEEALTFLLGAACGLQSAGLQKEGDLLLRVAGMIITVRGYSEIETIIKRADADGKGSEA